MDLNSDPELFPRLVREHQAMVYSLAWRILGNVDDAEEVAQEVFCKLFQNGWKLETERHVLFWLRQVAARQALDAWRRRKLRPRVGLEEVPEPVVKAPAAEPWREARLRQAMTKLPAMQRAVVTLRYQEGMEPREIAAAVGRPVFTVKSQLQRGLRRLREELADTAPMMERSMGNEY
jgi:RNA polymerase sigma-70 factor (ECF subfamily)